MILAFVFRVNFRLEPHLAETRVLCQHVITHFVLGFGGFGFDHFSFGCFGFGRFGPFGFWWQLF